MELRLCQPVSLFVLLLFDEKKNSRHVLVNLNIASYPPLDRTPPTDSDEVKQWKAEVANSGITIPNIKPNVAGQWSPPLTSIPFNFYTLQVVARPTQKRLPTQAKTAIAGGPVVDVPATPISRRALQKVIQTFTTNILCSYSFLGSWGLTFDDGPAPYTPALLKYLDEKDLKATFFTVGSRVLSYPAMLQAEYMEGHQVAGHTWAHPALTTLENDQIIAELGWTRKVMQEVIGVTPNMFRPPYGDIE